VAAILAVMRGLLLGYDTGEIACCAGKSEATTSNWEGSAAWKL
jgi:hypothetical protein